MSQNYYDLYIESVLQLAETLVIKSEYAATQINERLTALYGVTIDQNDKRTWKYYLNLAGEYHPTDPVITITSLDTLQQIVFNKANLQAHTATREAYGYNTRYYRELVTTYPDSEAFILGVLYPVDINKAIAAKDLSVIGYPPHLVEDNEMSLIENINEWVNMFDERWNNRQFALSDSYYVAALLGMIYSQLPAVIINLRLKACKTMQAHSYHVRQYLASHGGLDVYLSEMTQKQALFFYRNIRYIERNTGKKDTFEWLTDKVMTDRNLPLSEYTMRHDVQNIATSMVPEVTFRKTLLNASTSNAEIQENFHTLETVLSKEEPLEVGNAEYHQYNLSNIRAMFVNSLSSEVTTKVLESSVVDTTDAVPYTLHSVLLNYWIYMSNKNLYTAYVRIRDPFTGSEVTLSCRDACLYFFYAFSMSAGIEMTKIPQLFAIRVQRDPIPDNADLLSVVDRKYIPDSYADFVKDQLTPFKVCPSTSTFTDYCRDVHAGVMRQTYFTSNQENHYTRGLTEALVARAYSDYLLDDPNTGRLWSDWLSENKYPNENFTAQDWETVYKDLFEQATGVSMSVTENVSSLQKAMIGIMTQLSSYSVQFVSDINNESVKVLNWAAIRLGEITTRSKFFVRIADRFADVLQGISRGRDKDHIDFGNIISAVVSKAHNAYAGKLELPVKIKKGNDIKFSFKSFMGLPQILDDGRYFPATANVGKERDYSLLKHFYDLPLAERVGLPDVYSQCFIPPVIPTQANLDDFALYRELPGVQYLTATRPGINAFNYFYVPEWSYSFLADGDEVTLNAFYANNEPLTAPAIGLNTGHTKVGVFDYTGDIPEATVVTTAVFSGGVTGVGVFDPTVKTDIEYTINGFNKYYFKSDIDLKKVDGIGAFDLKGTAKNMTITWKMSVGSKSTTLKGISATKSIATKGVTSRFSFKAISVRSSIYFSLKPKYAKGTVIVQGSHLVSTMPATKGTAGSKTYRTKSVTGSTTLREFVRIYGQITNLEKFVVLRVSSTLSGAKSASDVKGLSKFKYITQSRTLSAFNYLLGSGGYTLSVKNSSETRKLNTHGSMHAVRIYPKSISDVASISLTAGTDSGSYATRGVSDVAFVTL